MCGRLIVVAAALVMGVTASTALAQCNCSALPTARPAVVSGYTACYAPTGTSYPVAPRVAAYAPIPPRVTYYAPVAQPYPVKYAPTAQPYMAYYGVAGWSIYGTPKVYVPGEPVRNAWRAITP